MKFSSDYDVIVVGAGPAGCAAAYECAAAGLSTLCIEEHGTIGYPIQCAGLLSLAAFDECRVSRRPVLNEVSGARVISGSGSVLHFDARKTKAVVVDRGALDLEMANAAADAGAEFLTKTAFSGLAGTMIQTRGVHGDRTFSFRILIAADGPRSTVARLMKMDRPALYLSGIQADISWAMNPRFVELYPDASPEFFGYAIPLGTGRARIGLCGQKNVREHFTAFRKKFSSGSLHLVTGTIPLGVMPRTYKNRTLFVGDAAGFAKPTTGGGVYTGIRSARHAASVAAACCELDRFDDAALAAYEEQWKADIGDMLATGLRLFFMRQQLRQEDIERLIRTMNDPGIIDAIIRYGDMDHPATLVRHLIKKPALLKLIGPVLKSGIRSLFP